MKTSLKLGGFGAVLTAVLAAAFGIGNALGPIGQAGQASNHSGHDMTDRAGHDQAGDHTAGHSEPGDGSDSLPGGLMVSDHGYTLEPASTVLDAGRTTVTFQVTGPDGQPVTDYKPTHDKELHFIAVRRDMSGYQHVHPSLDKAGTWTTELDLIPGVWRVFADFQPAQHGQTITLGGDISVAGNYQPQPLPPVSQAAKVDDYIVTLEGRLTSGESSELAFTVSRDGQPVTDLQPYLAAYGHLVALRSKDLAYLHVHPEGKPGDGTTDPGPDITFFATAPTAGPYRLYLDFKHDGVIRTAEFTTQATGTAAAAQPAPDQSESAEPTRQSTGGHGDHDH